MEEENKRLASAVYARDYGRSSILIPDQRAVA